MKFRIIPNKDFGWDVQREETIFVYNFPIWRVLLDPPYTIQKVTKWVDIWPREYKGKITGVTDYSGSMYRTLWPKSKEEIKKILDEVLEDDKKLKDHLDTPTEEYP